MGMIGAGHRVGYPHSDGAAFRRRRPPRFWTAVHTIRLRDERGLRSAGSDMEVPLRRGKADLTCGPARA